MINPLKIKEKDLPLIVLSDDRRSFIGWAIKAHSHGQYNHSMEMHRPGYFVSQNFGGFKEIPVKDYMKPSINLKFWKYKNNNKKIRKEWLESVKKDLADPWWRNMYDFPGLIGQLIPGRWTRIINIPWAKYCSERIRNRVLRVWGIFALPHSTPSEWNSIFKDREDMGVLGRWTED